MTHAPSNPPHVRRSSLKRNFLASMSGQFATNIANFLINVMLVAHLGQEAHGRYVLVLSITAIGVLIATSGLVGSLGVQRVAVASSRCSKETNRQINAFTGTSLLVAMALGAAMFLLAGPIARWQGEPIADLIRLASIWPLARVLLRASTMIGSGLESMGYNAVNTTLFHGSRVAWLGAAMLLGLTLEPIVVGWSAAMLVAGLVCLLTIRPLMRQLDLKLRPSFVGFGKLAKLMGQSLPFLIANASTMLMPALLQLLIGSRIDDAAAVSYFQVPFSLSLVILLFALPAASAVLPTISRLHASSLEDDRRRVRRISRKAYTRLAMLALIAVGMTGWAGQWLLVTIFKPAYGAYAPLLLLLTIAAGVAGLRLMLDRFLFAIERQRTVAVLEGIAYLVILALGWWLLPDHGLIVLPWIMIGVFTASLILRIAIVRAALDVRLALPTITWCVLVAAVWAMYSWLGPWAALGAGAAAAGLFHLTGKATSNP